MRNISDEPSRENLYTYIKPSNFFHTQVPFIKFGKNDCKVSKLQMAIKYGSCALHIR